MLDNEVSGFFILFQLFYVFFSKVTWFIKGHVRAKDNWNVN